MFVLILLCNLLEYGFYDEVKKRYSIRLWKSMVDVFNCMPCVAIIEDKIFCCHGGISPELLSLEQIHKIARPTDIPDAGDYFSRPCSMFCWSLGQFPYPKLIIFPLTRRKEATDLDFRLFIRFKQIFSMKGFSATCCGQIQTPM